VPIATGRDAEGAASAATVKRAGGCTGTNAAAPFTAFGDTAAGANATGSFTGTCAGSHGIASSAAAASEREGVNASTIMPAPITAPVALSNGRHSFDAGFPPLRCPVFFIFAASVFRLCMTPHLSRNASRALKIGFIK
jgi:hypothetical protein